MYNVGAVYSVVHKHWESCMRCAEGPETYIQVGVSLKELCVNMFLILDFWKPTATMIASHLV